MGRLLAKGAALGIVVLLSCAVILVAIPPPPTTYFTQTGEKWDAARRESAPQILLVGGSSTAFAFDSEYLSRALGMPVVNLGLNAGLGLRYMLDEVAELCDEGDVILLSPEYEHFYGDLFDGNHQLLRLARIHPPSARLMASRWQLLTMIRAFPNVVQEQLRYLWVSHRDGQPPSHPVYNQNAFNEYGDVVAHLGLDNAEPVAEMPFLNSADEGFNTRAVQALKDFHERVRGRAAAVFVTWPAIPRVHYDRRKEKLESIHARVLDESTIPVLAPPSAHVLTEDRFFDTVYHLNGSGREEHTLQVLELLQERGIGTGVGGAQ